ncbi:MAG: hypothetical protein ACMUJM_05445 [bacterium]
MNRILKEKRRNQLIYLIVAIITLIMIGNVGAAEASKHPSTKSTDISHRRFIFNNNTYDVYINHIEKFISVHGKANSWEEIKKIEKHFELTAPSDYEIAYDISLGYDNYKL